MYDFEEEYRKIFETPLDEIKEDIFFRTDNFENEEWYGQMKIYMAIGVCGSDREHVTNLQKALKVLGYSTCIKEKNGNLFLVPRSE